MNEHSMLNTNNNRYDDDIVRKFVCATILWGGVAFLLGVIIASQLFAWQLNFNLPFLTFGRLRPLHTNAAIFAFAGNIVFASVYYSMQRLLKTRMASDLLSRIHFWGWQLIIVSAALTIPFGMTTGKEYAELEWPIDIAIAVIWVVFAVNFFLTIKIRREKHIYVAIWFYMASVLTVALLHIANSMELPVSLFKSYSMYAGVQDALVQWWYGHNAVAFVLTTPFLGMMYYFLPKATGRPIYSYRLSILHFWSLVFIYIWAGPHHLLYTALPDWAQTLGMVFSIMLIAPSWGGMINGFLSMRGAWERVRTEPILKFFVVALTFYGMATFEGPLLSIKSVSALGHYTDWIIGHVHSGALGWNGFMTFAVLYWIVPKLWRTKLYSQDLANLHFWLGFWGIILYIVSMWISGITQGLMWRAQGADGRLIYPDFVQTVVHIIPLYQVRALGGLLFLSGFFVMVYNLIKTMKSAPALLEDEAFQASPHPDLSLAAFTKANEKPHRTLEALPSVFAVLAFLTVCIGSAVEVIPVVLSMDAKEVANLPTAQRPYRALELAGRDLYIREGCYNCHSQMIRPMAHEVVRYGDYSKPEESIYDHPFQWGSKRTGPDLARVGGKYPDFWHVRHMDNPREVTPGSNMPNYSWLIRDKTDFAILGKKLSVMRTLGVPYTQEQIDDAQKDAHIQASEITARLKEQGAGGISSDSEIVALIAYLQSLGVRGGTPK